MARPLNFDTLFNQLEAAIVTSRGLKLEATSDLLLRAFSEATQRMSDELLKSEKKTRKSGKRNYSPSGRNISSLISDCTISTVSTSSSTRYAKTSSSVRGSAPFAASR
jgi:hypothetical protein